MELNPVSSPSKAHVLNNSSSSEGHKKQKLEALIYKVGSRSLNPDQYEVKHLSTMSLKLKMQVVINLIKGVSHLYIDAKKGFEMATMIAQNWFLGKYDQALNPVAFKEALLEDLRVVCSDKHIDILIDKEAFPDYDPDRSLRTLSKGELTTEQIEYLEWPESLKPDFSKEVEAHMIEGTSTGYFRINMFPPLDWPETAVLIDREMQKVVGAETLVVDLRIET